MKLRLMLSIGACAALVGALIVLGTPASANDGAAAQASMGRAPVVLSLTNAGSATAVSGMAADPRAGETGAANPYGIASVWKGSDIVARFVLALLVIMSGGSWYILVAKSLEHSRMSRHAKTAARSFWAAQTVSAGASAL